MKKLIAVAAIAVSMFSVNANASPLLPIGVGTGAGASASVGAGPAGVGLVVGFLVARNMDKPIPYNLTDACKAQTVKKEGANYSYTTFEGCIK
jgi:hypothetical protein